MSGERGPTAGRSWAVREVDAYLKRVRDIAEAEYQEWAKNPSPPVQRLRALKAERERRLA